MYVCVFVRVSLFLCVSEWTCVYTYFKMKRVNDNATFLKATTLAHPEQCKALLKTAKQVQLDAICEILLNIVRGVIPLKEELFKKESRYRKVLRKIVTKCMQKTVRRELMIKYFGILQKLLTAALPIVGLILTGIEIASGSS